MTIAKRPSQKGGIARVNHIVLKKRNRIFSQGGWTGIRGRCPSGKSVDGNQRESGCGTVLSSPSPRFARGKGKNVAHSPRLLLDRIEFRQPDHLIETLVQFLLRQW